MSLRNVAERLSRGVVLKRRLPQAFGGAWLHVSPEGGGLRYWRHDVEKIDPGIFRAIDLLVAPGARVWDIGANMGLFTFAAAGRAGTRGWVLGIEPDVDSAQLLLRTRSALPTTYAPVQILTCAICEAASTFVEFEIAARARSANSIKGSGLTQRGGVRETRIVPAVNLDALLAHFGAPNVVKIDVEGAEMRVLEGATQLLARARPIVVIEVEEESAQVVDRRLRAANYRFFDGDNATGAWAESGAPSWNTWAVPVEKIDATLARAKGR
jgi:FkbM family methyltransferase